MTQKSENGGATFDDNNDGRGPSPEPFLSTKGYCVTCDSNVTFESFNPWLRDHFLCSNCRSIPRERALMLAIERFFPSWHEFRIHESSPCGRGASVKLGKECREYIGSHFFPDVPLGETHASGWRCENLEALSFPDESFDMVVTQDVMEHIFDPAKAFAEIARTLKPGGSHVFTVPIVRKDKASQVRALRHPNGNVEHLLPENYHGNPIDANGSLVTIDWGYDIVPFIEAHSGLRTTIIYFDDLAHGIRAELIEVLISRKLRAVSKLTV
ncbi:methyltransferase domain-containing protein [Methylolobus aquaticus]